MADTYHKISTLLNLQRSCAETGPIPGTWHPLTQTVKLSSSFFKTRWIFWHHSPSPLHYLPQQQCGRSSCVWAPTLSAGSAEWWHCAVDFSATKGPFVSRGTRAHTLSTMRLFTVSLHNERQGVGCRVRKRDYSSSKSNSLL